jgi:hypothetical protein
MTRNAPSEALQESAVLQREAATRWANYVTADKHVGLPTTVSTGLTNAVDDAVPWTNQAE